MENINQVLKDLTPQQKITLLESLREEEPDEEKKYEWAHFLEEIKEEQQTIEKRANQPIQARLPEQSQEEALEVRVAETPENKEQKEKIQIDTYGLEKTHMKYTLQEERYHREQRDFSAERFTEEERKKLKRNEEAPSQEKYHR